MHQQRAMRVNFLPAESQFELWMALISRSVAASYMIGARWESAHGRNCDEFLERWRQAHVYAELRVLEQLDETVAECIGAAAEDGISANDLKKRPVAASKSTFASQSSIRANNAQRPKGEKRPANVIGNAVVHVMRIATGD